MAKLFWVLVVFTALLSYKDKVYIIIKLLKNISLILFKICYFLSLNCLITFMNLNSMLNLMFKIVTTISLIFSLDIVNNFILLSENVSFIGFYDFVSIAILIFIYKIPLSIVYNLKNELKVYLNKKKIFFALLLKQIPFV